MKRRLVATLVVALLCLWAVAPAQAQLLQWGVKGGVNMTKIDFDEGYKDKMAGFFIGPMAEVTIPVVGLGMDAALLFSQKGIKADNGTLKQFGIDIPVNLKYTLGLGSMLGVYLAAGPDFYFDFKGEKHGVERKRSQVGINVGGGVKLFRHLQAGISYNIPMGDHFTFREAGQALRKGKDKTWQLSLAYMF